MVEEMWIRFNFEADPQSFKKGLRLGRTACLTCNTSTYYET